MSRKGDLLRIVQATKIRVLRNGIHKLESVQKIETQKILWNFEI